MDEKDKIRNIGPKSAAWLRQVGLRTQEDLVRIGPVEAFLKMKRAGFKTGRNLLYSLAGAIDDCHWTNLPEERKAALLQALEAAQAANPIKTNWQKAAERSAHDPMPQKQSLNDETEPTASAGSLDDPDSEGEPDSSSESGTDNYSNRFE